MIVRLQYPFIGIAADFFYLNEREKVMRVLFEGKIFEVEDSLDTSYILQDNELFYDIGFKVMQNLEDGYLVKCHKLKYNGKIKFVYLTEDYMPVSRLMTNSTPDSLQIILKNLFEVFIQIEALGFLDVTFIENRLDKIFVDPISNSIRVIYLPISGLEYKKSKIEFENEVKSQLVDLIENVYGKEQLNTRIIRDSLTDKTAHFHDIIRNFAIQKSPEQNIVVQEQTQSANGIVLQEINNAVFFSIEGRDFVIGKKQEKVDGVIAGNTAVSRIHCKIIYRDGHYYIIDLGSSNGTFLNGSRVTTTPLLIQIGSKIRIANVEFIVRGR